MQILSTVVNIFIVLCFGITLNAEGTEGNNPDQRMKTMKPCPSSPNCVSSQAGDPRHSMEPIPFTGSRDAAQARLRAIIQSMPRSKVMKEETGYLAVSFRSRIFGFVDEAEFSFDEHTGSVHFRSGASTGYYDFGINRSRMQRIAEAFKAAD